MATTASDITNAKYLNEQAIAKGYVGPEMSSVEALRWLIGNPDGEPVQQSNAQKILGHDQRLSEIDNRSTFRGVYTNLESANNITNKHDGDTILVGDPEHSYKLYTFFH